MRIDDSAALDRLDFARGGGLIAVIAQHAHTGEVLMLAYANREALERTLAERVMWYFSRSRDELWRKGDTSGNVQNVVSLHGDCDGDAVLARVLPAGPACHTGAANCFDAAPTLTALDRVIAERAPELADGRLFASSYVRRYDFPEEDFFGLGPGRRGGNTMDRLRKGMSFHRARKQFGERPDVLVADHALAVDHVAGPVGHRRHRRGAVPRARPLRGRRLSGWRGGDGWRWRRR